MRQANTPANPERLAQLRKQLDDVYSVFPQSFAAQRRRNQAAFVIQKEIEELESPDEFAKNAAHWNGHELRF